MNQRRFLRAAAALLLLPGPVAAQTAPRVHRLPATPATVAWGYYAATAKPVLRVASGDIVEVETLLTSTPGRLEAAGVPAAQVEASLRSITDSVTDKGPGGHILTGPIYVEGAEPGDVLEVRIQAVGFAIGYGYNGCSGFLRELCGEQQRTRIIALDTVRRTADLGGGILVPLHPFFGSMGVAPPPDSGRVSSNPPGIHAGNLDNKELVAGTTLFIPVHVAGALFEVGDGHAAQGDGEVDQTAIETSLRGRLQLIVRKDLRLTWPRAETPTHMIVMGTDTSLTVATRIAVREMVAYLMEAKGLDRMEAYRLASIAADLRITQLVDGRVGVHMMIPKAILGVGSASGPASGPAPDREALLDPSAPLWRATAPDRFRVRVTTSRGDFTIEADRAWAPRGADRLYQLARGGFFDDSRFFRVRAGYIAQFGIPGDPAVARVWRDRRIPDDPVREPNRRGTVAFAMTGPDTRTTQLYINLRENLPLDSQGFAPLGRVVEGMDVVDRLYGGYGEGAGGGMRGGKQGPIFEGGNRYLDAAYPALDRLLRARIEPVQAAASYPAPVEGDYVVRDFTFQSGERLPELRLHYRTIGTPVKDAAGVVRNAVLIMHGTTGSGAGFLSPTFAGQLFGSGQLLDATRYFIILPDAIGHGKSSKPSDGMHMKFPKYTYDDMVRAEYRLVSEKLGVNHLRLVTGTSMGAMHTWVWGYTYPDFMDALMPLASLPVEIAGRNRMMRQMIIDDIETDPDWKGGEYTAQPRGLIAAVHVLLLMTSAPLQWQKDAPTRTAAEASLKARVARSAAALDANDMLYAFEASRNYNPSPHLGEITAPLYAINSADDQVNPPELGIMEREIGRVPHGRFILIPISDQTRGHGTHSLPAVWGGYLAELLKASEPGAAH